MSDKRDANDVARENGSKGLADELEDMTDAAVPVPTAPEWTSPISFNKVHTPPSFPIGLFPPWLEDFTVDVARALEVPLDLPGICALGVLATCFQKRFEVQINSDYREPLSLHLVCGYESGGGKSPVFPNSLSRFVNLSREKMSASHRRF